MAKQALSTPMLVAIIGGAFFLVAWGAGVFEQVPNYVNPGNQAKDGIQQLVKFTLPIHDAFSSSTNPVGSIYTYYPTEASAGTYIEATALSGGVFTSTQSYMSGEPVFLKFVPTNTSCWFEYGMIVTPPNPEILYDTVTTVSITDSFTVYNMGDVTNNSTNKDVAIQKNAVDVYNNPNRVISERDGYVTLGAATDAFNPQTDATLTGISVRFSNEDTQKIYADPRSYYDWSEPIAEKRQKGSYLVVNFDLSGATNVYDAVGDYDLRFASLGGGQWFKSTFTGDTVVIVPLTTERQCAGYKTDASSNILGNLNGKVVAWDAILDFGGLSSTDWADEIDIEISIMSSYALNYAISQNTLSYDTFNSGSAAHAFGELSSAWSYDCSIG